MLRPPGVGAGDMGGPGDALADAEAGLQPAGGRGGQYRVSVEARCGGVSGTLAVHTGGDFLWVPFSEPHTVCPAPCNWQPAAETIILAKDAIGATVERSGSGDSGGGVVLRVWYCVPQQSTAPGGSRKLRYKLRQSAKYEVHTLEDAVRMQETVRRVCAWWGRSTPPHLLLIANPCSGKGRSLSLLNSCLLPALQDAAGFKVTVHKTAGPAHATELLAGADLAGVDMVLLLGGDGTVFEGLQGLMCRPDWEAACKVPFAHLPGGSGNGLAASCGLWDAPTAAVSVVKGHTAPLDITSVVQPSTGRRYYSFLSLVFGLFANLDIGTEHQRWLGDARYTLKGLQQAAAVPVHPMRVAYLSVEPLLPQTNSTEAAASTAGAGDVHAALLTQHSESSDRAGRRGGGGIGGGAPPLKSAAPPGSGTCGGGEGAGGDGLACGPPLPLLAAWRAGEAAATAVGGADASSGSAAAVPSLPLSLCNHSGGDGSSSGDGLPAGWSLLPSTQLHMMCAYNVPFMATHACLNPQGRLNDGCLNLMHMSGLCGFGGRLKFAQMLLQAEDGGHTDLDFVHTEQVRALAVEPLCDDTWMVLDGEVIPNATLFLEVHPGLVRTCVAPGFVDE